MGPINKKLANFEIKQSIDFVSERKKQASKYHGLAASLRRPSRDGRRRTVAIHDAAIARAPDDDATATAARDVSGRIRTGDHDGSDAVAIRGTIRCH